MGNDEDVCDRVEVDIYEDGESGSDSVAVGTVGGDGLTGISSNRLVIMDSTIFPSCGKEYTAYQRVSLVNGCVVNTSNGECVRC